jgi:hypothetical protein
VAFVVRARPGAKLNRNIEGSACSKADSTGDANNHDHGERG